MSFSDDQLEELENNKVNYNEVPLSTKDIGVIPEQKVDKLLGGTGTTSEEPKTPLVNAFSKPEVSNNGIRQESRKEPNIDNRLQEIRNAIREQNPEKQTDILVEPANKNSWEHNGWKSPKWPEGSKTVNNEVVIMPDGSRAFASGWILSEQGVLFDINTGTMIPPEGEIYKPNPEATQASLDLREGKISLADFIKISSEHPSDHIDNIQVSKNLQVESNTQSIEA